MAASGVTGVAATMKSRQHPSRTAAPGEPFAARTVGADRYFRAFSAASLVRSCVTRAGSAAARS